MTNHRLILPAESVRAILDGSKTQHRLPVTASNSTVDGGPTRRFWPHLHHWERAWIDGCYLGQYVHVPAWNEDGPPPDDKNKWLWYRVYPKWGRGDRLWVQDATLEVTAVRAERTQEISEADASLFAWVLEFRVVKPTKEN